MKTLRIASTVAILALSISAFAADVSGKWTGKMKMDMAALKQTAQAQAAKATPEMKKMIESQMAMASSIIGAMKFSMDIKKDGTYTMTTSGAPGAKGNDTESGKWTLKGNVLTMTGSKNGKGPKTITGTVAANGRSIFFDLSKVAKEQAGKNGAPKDAKIPAMTLTFTKA